MSEFTAAPYRGDPNVPHAREGNFTVRFSSSEMKIMWYTILLETHVKERNIYLTLYCRRFWEALGFA